MAGNSGDSVAGFVAGAGAGVAPSVSTVAASVESPTTATLTRSASRAVVAPGPSGSLGDSAGGRIRGWGSRTADNTAAGPADTGRPEQIPRRAFGRSAPRWCLQMEAGSCHSQADVNDVDVWSRWFCGRSCSMKVSFPWSFARARARVCAENK